MKSQRSICYLTLVFLISSAWTQEIGPTDNPSQFQDQDLRSGSRKIFDLPDDYDKELPPQRKKGEPIRISLSIFIREISDVIEERSEVKMFLHVFVHWKEERLTLVDKAYFENEETLMLDPKALSKFWLPDIYITNMKSLEATSFLEKIESIQIFGNKTVRYSIAGEVTVVCPMDFVLYPLDIQSCHLDFTSYSFGKKIMIFEWRNDPPLRFAEVWDHLPHFEVQMQAELGQTVVAWQNVDFSAARLYLVLRRRLGYYVLQTYIPSALFVCISWMSFIVPPEVVPGRMVLLVTTLLTLVTMYEAVRTRSPPAQGIKCIEVWLVACIGFVFFALLEYAFCFYIVKYTSRTPTASAHKQRLWKRPTVSPKDGQGTRRANRPRFVASPLWMRKTRLAWTHLKNHFGSPTLSTVVKRRVNSSASSISGHLEPATMSMSEQGPKEISSLEPLDRVSLGLFPTGFLIFNIAYWAAYIGQNHSIKVYLKENE